MAERQFGPYRLVHQIATGGMAEIHLAKTRGIGGFEKYIALKMIHPNFSSDEHFIEMLVDEAKISVQLQHVNIAHIFDLGRVGDTYYIAMEYVDGCDLYKVLRKASEQDRAMPIELATFIAKEVCVGLDYAHRKRDGDGNPLMIVHRDISPQNVLLSHAGEVKIVDFGIAKASSRVRQTGVGVIKGKYYYMSPEQAWGDPLDYRTDIFSTGILLYEMLTGQMLYLEEDLHKLLDMVRKADIPPPSSKRADLPADLDRIVMRALAKKPGQRWQTAHELGGALEHFLQRRAPDFTPQRLAGFIGQVLGEATPPPATSSQPVAPSRVTKGLGREAIMSRSEFTDENSVIFKMADMARRAGERGPAGESRRAAEEPRRPAAPGLPPLPARPAPGAAPARPAVPARAVLAATPAPSPRMPNVATPHVPLPPEAEDRTVVSGPPGFGEDLPTGDMGAPPEMEPGLESGDRPLEWRDDRRDFPSHPPTAAAGPRAIGLAPEHLEDDDTTNVKAQAPPPPGELDALDEEDLHPTRRAPRGISPLSLPPLRSPRPAISAIASPRPSRRTPMALPAVHAPAPDPRPATPPAPAGVAEAPTQMQPMPVQPMQPVPPMPQGTPPDLPQGMASAVPELPLAAPLDTPPPGTLKPVDWGTFGARAPASSSLPGAGPTPAPSAFDTLSPSADDLAAYRIGAGPGGSRKKWLAAGLAIIALGVIALVVAVATRSSTPAPRLAALEVISLPAGASVELDGRAAGTTPVTIDKLPAGKPVRLRLTLAKHEPWERDEAIAQPTTIKVIAQLKRIRGTLRVDSVPLGAEVFLNNQSLGLTPLARSDLDPFEDGTIEVRKAGFKPKRQALAWQGQTQAELRFTLDPARK